MRLRAERRAGELLADVQRAEKPNAKGANQHSEVVSNVATQPKSDYSRTLESTGLTRQTAHRYQQLAAVPAEQFERHLSDESDRRRSHLR